MLSRYCRNPDSSPVTGEAETVAIIKKKQDKKQM